MNLPTTCIAFEGTQRIASGAPHDVAAAVKAAHDRGERAPTLVFDATTSRPVEFDLRGTLDDVLARIAGSLASSSTSIDESDASPRGRGRPRLGVVAREVTLLPRHWEWLNAQPGGASVALRKLVDSARLANGDKERTRAAQESAYRFMTAMAGNLPNYEDATRALYANQPDRFDDLTAAWPVDVRDHARKLASTAFA